MKDFKCNETTPSCYGYRAGARGPLTCEIESKHAPEEMHRDPTRGTWKHPRVPYGSGRRPRRLGDQ